MEQLTAKEQREVYAFTLDFYSGDNMRPHAKRLIANMIEQFDTNAKVYASTCANESQNMQTMATIYRKVLANI
jgi:hypothetical protein